VRPRRAAGTRGQSSVELLALLPFALAVALAAAQVLAAQAAGELARHAAEAGAVALLEHADGATAAREAVPGADRSRFTVAVRGRRVTVTIRPKTIVPGVAALLRARAIVVAGAER
jgi:hypothetical protein